jgi:single-strand DNA-binding protein
MRYTGVLEKITERTGMASGNNVTLVGNITRDPELNFTPSGAAVVKFGLAVNKRWPDKDGEWQEKTSFFNVTVWREQAENCAESLVKGARVIVTGELEQRSWETDEGENRSVVEVQAEEIGPSLRWATAEVTKVERDESPKRSNKSKPASRQKSRRQEPEYDEEPF